MMHVSRRPGVTLIEVMFMVTVLIIVLSAITLALDPLEKQRRSRNMRRVADLEAIATAFFLYTYDEEDGAIPLYEDDSVIMITDGEVACDPPPDCPALEEAVTGCADFSMLVEGNYLSRLPADPRFAENGITSYVIVGGPQSALVACHSEEQGPDDELPFIDFLL